jgi:hypothetical protein
VERDGRESEAQRRLQHEGKAAGRKTEGQGKRKRRRGKRIVSGG